MKRFLTIICCACLLYAGYSAVFADEPVYKEYTVTVADGETLWDIAGRHTEEREDVREVIFRIAQANKLKSKTIYPGQVLKCILSTKIPQKERINSLFSAREFPYLKLELYC